jgi:acyl carrier protein
MTHSEIKNWVVEWLSDELGIDPEDFELDRTFGSYRFDADTLEALGADIEEYFEEAVDPAMLDRRSTAVRLTKHICQLMDTDDGEELDDAGEQMRDVEMGEVLRDLGFGGHA